MIKNYKIFTLYITVVRTTVFVQKNYKKNKPGHLHERKDGDYGQSSDEESQVSVERERQTKRHRTDKET